MWEGGGGEVQGTDGEDSHEREFLPARELQMREERHRHDEESQVGGDVHGRVEEPQRLEAEAGAWDFAIPEPRHRDAVDVAADDGPGGVGDHDAHGDVAGEPEVAVREDAQVLEEDGEFGAGQTGVVHGDGGP